MCVSASLFGVRWPQPPLLYATERGHHPPKAVAAATALQMVPLMLAGIYLDCPDTTSSRNDASEWKRV